MNPIDANGLIQARIDGKLSRRELVRRATALGFAAPVIATMLHYLTGAVLTETVFAWPGMGRLFFDALDKRDYPVLMGVLMLGAVLIVLGNLIADLVYGLLDPRLKYG